MQGTLYMNGKEVQVIDKPLEIKSAKIIGIDYAKGKDITRIAYKGTMTMKTGAGWEEFKLFITIEREKHLKNIAAFRAAWADKRKGSV